MLLNTFGDIKIDKIQALYEKALLPQEWRYESDNAVNQYYHDYISFNKAGYIFDRFTPTKLSNSLRGDVVHNLQMPSEIYLQESLEDITLHNKFLQKNMKITELHLTKDLVLDYAVYDYIQLLKCLIYSRLEYDVYASKDGEETFTLHYKHNGDSRKGLQILIKFYNKASEYYKKHGTYISKLAEPLSKLDIKKVGDAYDPKENTLDLSKVNILRVEMVFKTTKKLLPVMKALSCDGEYLSVYDLIRCLREGTLYKRLDKVFTDILMEKIFNKEKTFEEVTAGINNIRKQELQLLLNLPDPYYFQAVIEDLGLEGKFSDLFTMARKVRPDSELYTELYNKLFESTDIRDNLVLLEYFVRGCSSYSSEDLKDILLAYDVPIWDDS